MIVFVRATDPAGIGSLVFTEGQGTKIPARSGPWGKGPLPPGRYHLGKPVPIDPREPLNAPYVDAKGNAWWCPITPQFTTTRKSLGLHADGGVSGSLGCIAVTVLNTKPVFEMLHEGDVLIVV